MVLEKFKIYIYIYSLLALNGTNNGPEIRRLKKLIPTTNL